MSKATESRLFNELPAVGWAKIHPPRYHAVEAPDQAGVYVCQARGGDQWTAAQLEAWAVQIGVELVFITWVRPQEVA